jgi:two-component sensor histidine kinase
MMRFAYNMVLCAVKVLQFAFFMMPVILYAQTSQDLTIIYRAIQDGANDTATIGKLLNMGEVYLDKPGSLEADMNMVFTIAGKMETLSRNLHYSRGIGMSKLLQAKAFRESGHADRGRKVSEEAVQLLNIYGTPVLQAQAVIELGGTYSNETPDLPRKIELYLQGADIFMHAGEELKAAQMKEFIGDLLQLNRDYTRSLQVLQESLSLYKKNGYQRLQGVYSLLGDAYNGVNNFTQSLRYNLLAVETGEKLDESGPIMSTIYNRVGLFYYRVNYYDQAIYYYNKGLAFARSRNDTPTAKTMLVNMSTTFYNKGEYKRSLDSLNVAVEYGPSADMYEMVLIDICYLKNYIALKAFDKAQNYFDKLLHATRKSNELNELSLQSARLAIVYYLQSVGRFKETTGFLNAYEKNKKTVPMPLHREADAEYLSYKTDSALGNLNSAIRHFRLYKTLSDSLTSIYQARQLGILQLQFETERKDKDIELLTQKSQLQEVSLQKEKVFRNVFVGGICMLLVFLTLLYNRYRLKKRITSRLELQQYEINTQNEVLKKLVDEKEWLLKEIHHRVKNNLQIIISLLNTQSQYLDNDDAIMAIRNSQHRMYAMSLIHQRLYQTENLGEIDMNWYIAELICYMKECFDTGGKITFAVDNDNISLSVVQAVPLGLILNEAISNSIKYAFPGNRKGRISISFKKDGDHHCRLAICDDGIGFKDNYVLEESASLGMSLMKGLAEQLDANYTVKSSNDGVAICIRFQCRLFSDETINKN